MREAAAHERAVGLLSKLSVLKYLDLKKKVTGVH